MANLGIEPHNKLRFAFLDAKEFGLVCSARSSMWIPWAGVTSKISSSTWTLIWLAHATLSGSFTTVTVPTHCSMGWMVLRTSSKSFLNISLSKDWQLRPPPWAGSRIMFHSWTSAFLSVIFSPAPRVSRQRRKRKFTVGGWSTIWSLLPSGLRHLWKRLPRCAWPNV